MAEYEFTADWTSRRYPVWTKVLSTYVGTPAKFLEIGSLEGRSALWFVDNILTHPDASITCVDPWIWPEFEARFDENVSRNDQPQKIIKCKGESFDVLRSWPLQQFDVIYVDGSHEGRNILEDACLSFHLAKPGGLIMFDDYKWNHPRKVYTAPQVAIDSFLQIWGPWVDLIYKRWMVIVKVRQEPRPRGEGEAG